MDFHRRPLTRRTDIWREGKYLDLWSVPHFLSGLVLGLFLYFLNIPPVYSLSISFLLLVMYEMWEAMVQIEETHWNKTLDVVVGMTSCTLALIYAPAFAVEQVVFVFVVASVLDLVLSYFGWRASQKAARFEAEVRRDITERRRRLMVRLRGGRTGWKRNRSHR